MYSIFFINIKNTIIKKLWEEIEREKAKQRQQATQFGNTTVKEHSPAPSENGRSRDIIASKVGLG